MSQEIRQEVFKLRTYVLIMVDVGEVQAAVAALRAAHDALAALSVEQLTAAELLGVLDDLETLTCQLPVQGTGC